MPEESFKHSLKYRANLNKFLDGVAMIEINALALFKVIIIIITKTVQKENPEFPPSEHQGISHPVNTVLLTDTSPLAQLDLFRLNFSVDDQNLYIYLPSFF